MLVRRGREHFFVGGTIFLHCLFLVWAGQQVVYGINICNKMPLACSLRAIPIIGNFARSHVLCVGEMVELRNTRARELLQHGQRLPLLFTNSLMGLFMGRISDGLMGLPYDAYGNHPHA